MWADFRGIRDPWLRKHDLDLFENSRRATRAQRNYAIANPGKWAGYDADCWGLTACDGPGDFKTDIGGRQREFFSYSARGPGDRDDGTLAPTALAGSIAFEPELVTAALSAIHRRYGAAIYGQYGFLDAFNPSLADATAGTDFAPRPDHSRAVLGRHRLSRDRPRPDRGHDRQPSRRFHLEAYARLPAADRRLGKRAGFTGGWLDRAA